MRTFIIIALISSACYLHGQTLAELMIVQRKQQEKEKPALNMAEFTGSVTGTLFVFYKTAISSQDYYSCNFTPSCSEHAHQAITRQGIFFGLLNSLDRLTRCHGLSRRNYPIDPKTFLLSDPLRDVHFNPL